MKALLNACNRHKAALVAYNGQGTSYGLMGHTALHWAAAKVTTIVVILLYKDILLYKIMTPPRVNQ